MSTAIHLTSVRNHLAPRREPYWGPPIEQGRFVGVRKLEDGTCTWIARLRDDRGQQKYRSLGQATDKFNHTAAKRAAEDWFRNYDVDVVDTPLTVTQACLEYVADLEVTMIQAMVAECADNANQPLQESVERGAALVRLALGIELANRAIER